MSLPSLPDRGDVLQMLASYGDRAPQEVGEQLGSLEVTWLIAQAEQRYAVVLDLPDEAFAAMQTVTGAVQVLRAAVAGAHAGTTPAHAAGTTPAHAAGTTPVDAGGTAPAPAGGPRMPGPAASPAGAERAGSLAEGGNG